MIAASAAMNEAILAVAIAPGLSPEYRADLCAKLHRLCSAIGHEIGGTTNRVRVLSMLGQLCHQAETAGRHHDLMAGVEVPAIPERLIAAGLAVAS